MSAPNRFPSGLSTNSKNTPLGNYPYPANYNAMVEYVNDYVTLIGTDYTVSGTSSTFALTSGLGGLAIITPGGTTTATSAYKAAPFLQFNSGKQFWYETRVQVSSVTAPTAYFGLQSGSSANDGIWFAMAAGGVVNLISTVGSAATTLAAAVTTMVSATAVDLGFYYNGTDLLVFVNGALVARILNPTIGASATTLTSNILSPVFQITPTATQTITTDGVLASCEIIR